jgi:hypothetical protein
VHMDENFFANSMEALRPATQVLGFLSLLPPINDLVEQLVVVLLVLDFVGVAVSVKDMGKSFSPVRCFHWRGFLNPSLVMQVNLSHKVSLVSASTTNSPTAIKGEDFRVNSMTQSQKWRVG